MPLDLSYPIMQYDFGVIEKRWQEYWQEHNTFGVLNPADDGFVPDKPKYYVLAMFPYPSGEGLHMGHVVNYTITDVVARYKRMCGFNVLHPMGFDAFGLPAEQYAIEHGVHPRVTTQKNIDIITRQLRQLGLSADWDRCFATTDNDYYRWTQWIFLQLHNSWFDPSKGKARPIQELINALESGEMDVGPDGELVPVSLDGAMETLGGQVGFVRKWTELTEQQRRNLIDEYRLAYLAEVDVNWCPALGTVLADEEVTSEGRSERGNHPVYKRPLRQWMLRITAYADRLLEEINLVDWPEPIKIMQRNWIGRSEGAQVDFALPDHDEVITVFTTRPDTLFGATYMVLAPEHPLVGRMTTTAQREAVRSYQQQALATSEVQRQAERRDKTGVFTGGYAVNPTNQERVPIWIADYVMMGYGTGAIMAVPAHDQRDFEFAKQFDLPIRGVVMPSEAWFAEMAPQMLDATGTGGKALAEADFDRLRARYAAEAGTFPSAFTGDGVNVNSRNDEVCLDGSPTDQAKKTITDYLAMDGLAKHVVQYRLRDWLFSRQRYWGEPFPILHGPKGQIVAIDESELPVALPEMSDFKPPISDATDAPPQPPLARAPDDWKYVAKNGVQYTREFNTMPQWAGSCWYYLRFLDPKNDQHIVGEQAEQYWMAGPNAGKASRAGGVDLYVGGAEHAVLHLLYARFWHKVLHDLGHVSGPEPFGRLFNQGYIQANAYTDRRGVYVEAAEVVDEQGRPADAVDDKGAQCFYKGEPVSRELGKMGKSLKNAIAPDQINDDYGCDTLRLYVLYMGPLDHAKLWRTRDIVGPHRFLHRLWRNLIGEDGTLKVSLTPPTSQLRRLLHKTIRKVTDDMERLSFNTAIAALIELNNDLVALDQLPREVAEPLVLMLSPMAPHICEELWKRMGFTDSLAYESWPSYDQALLVEEEVEYPVQINGKLRGRITVPADSDDKAIESAALADQKVQRAIGGKSVRKVIIIKGRMINVVAK